MNEIFYKFEYLINNGSINNFLRALLEIVELEPDFLDMAINSYLDIIENFRNSVLIKVSSWIIG